MAVTKNKHMALPLYKSLQEMKDQFNLRMPPALQITEPPAMFWPGAPSKVLLSDARKAMQVMFQQECDEFGLLCIRWADLPFFRPHTFSYSVVVLFSN